jgi:hypothetical protein
MAYDPLDTTKPTTAGSPEPTRQASIDAIRHNLAALRDALAAGGFVQGFNYEPSGGSAEQPAILYYKRGTEWIKLSLTWGTTGGEAGNVTKIVYQYSANSGGAYDSMADGAGKYVLSLSYDSSGNCTGGTWGSTP